MDKAREIRLCKEILDAPNDKYAMELIEFYGQEKYQEGLKTIVQDINEEEQEIIIEKAVEAYKKSLIEKIEEKNKKMYEAGFLWTKNDILEVVG